MQSFAKSKFSRAKFWEKLGKRARRRRQLAALTERSPTHLFSVWGAVGKGMPSGATSTIFPPARRTPRSRIGTSTRASGTPLTRRSRRCAVACRTGTATPGRTDTWCTPPEGIPSVSLPEFKQQQPLKHAELLVHSREIPSIWPRARRSSANPAAAPRHLARRRGAWCPPPGLQLQLFSPSLTFNASAPVLRRPSAQRRTGGASTRSRAPARCRRAMLPTRSGICG